MDKTAASRLKRLNETKVASKASNLTGQGMPGCDQQLQLKL